MAIKTRYLQLSDVIMFEYNLLQEGDYSSVETAETVMWTKLNDGHYALVSPISCENELVDSSYKKLYDPTSLNTLNHFAISKDKNNSEYYTFLDPDYEYITQSIVDDLSTPAANENVKVKEYSRYLTNPTNDASTNKFEKIELNGAVRWDNMKLYFVNGYDFSNIYGVLSRIYVERNDGTFLDLCDFFFTKQTAFSLIKYLDKPIIFGDNIYDRYIELNLLCLYDIMNGVSALPYLTNKLNIALNGTLKLGFSYVLDDNYVVNDLTYTVAELAQYPNITTKNVNCTFSKSSSVKGVVPTESINSDNIGLYIAESPDYPYIEFYGTWKGDPLKYDTVQEFNRSIKLYDKSLAQPVSTYEVDEDYTAETNVKRWVAMHEITCSLCMYDYVVKKETYNMSQIFTSPKDDVKFYYRPMIFDENIGYHINNIQITYTMRFVNVDDRVQFVKTGTLSLYNNLNKFFAKGTTLTTSDLTPYRIINKITENKQSINGTSTGISTPKTKYVKVFYNSSDVVMTDSGSVSYESDGYTQQFSQVSRNYKFVFKKRYSDGKYSYMDLSDGYYKLYAKTDDGEQIIIEPTYSSNMNLSLGELEFNLSSANIDKLSNVSSDNRKMSIVSISDNNVMSSMYDFNYTF